jgi:hypothetical protein
MGSSILTGKRAGAMQKADGEWIYALFERGYVRLTRQNGHLSF